MAHRNTLWHVHLDAVATRVRVDGGVNEIDVQNYTQHWENNDLRLTTAQLERSLIGNSAGVSPLRTYTRNGQACAWQNAEQVYELLDRLQINVIYYANHHLHCFNQHPCVAIVGGRVEGTSELFTTYRWRQRTLPCGPPCKMQMGRRFVPQRTIQGVDHEHIALHPVQRVTLIRAGIETQSVAPRQTPCMSLRRCNEALLPHSVTDYQITHDMDGLPFYSAHTAFEFPAQQLAQERPHTLEMPHREFLPHMNLARVLCDALVHSTQQRIVNDARIRQLFTLNDESLETTLRQLLAVTVMDVDNRLLQHFATAIALQAHCVYINSRNECIFMEHPEQEPIHKDSKFLLLIRAGTVLRVPPSCGYPLQDNLEREDLGSGWMQECLLAPPRLFATDARPPAEIEQCNQLQSTLLRQQETLRHWERKRDIYRDRLERLNAYDPGADRMALDNIIEDLRRANETMDIEQMRQRQQAQLDLVVNRIDDATTAIRANEQALQRLQPIPDILRQRPNPNETFYDWMRINRIRGYPRALYEEKQRLLQSQLQGVNAETDFIEWVHGSFFEQYLSVSPGKCSDKTLRQLKQWKYALLSGPTQLLCALLDQFIQRSTVFYQHSTTMLQCAVQRWKSAVQGPLFASITEQERVDRELDHAIHLFQGNLPARPAQDDLPVPIENDDLRYTYELEIATDRQAQLRYVFSSAVQPILLRGYVTNVEDLSENLPVQQDNAERVQSFHETVMQQEEARWNSLARKNPFLISGTIVPLQRPAAQFTLRPLSRLLAPNTADVNAYMQSLANATYRMVVHYTRSTIPLQTQLHQVYMPTQLAPFLVDDIICVYDKDGDILRGQSQYCGTDGRNELTKDVREPPAALFLATTLLQLAGHYIVHQLQCPVHLEDALRDAVRYRGDHLAWTASMPRLVTLLENICMERCFAPARDTAAQWTQILLDDLPGVERFMDAFPTPTSSRDILMRLMRYLHLPWTSQYAALPIFDARDTDQLYLGYDRIQRLEAQEENLQKAIEERNVANNDLEVERVANAEFERKKGELEALKQQLQEAIREKNDLNRRNAALRRQDRRVDQNTAQYRARLRQQNDTVARLRTENAQRMNGRDEDMATLVDDIQREELQQRVNIYQAYTSGQTIEESVANLRTLADTATQESEQAATAAGLVRERLANNERYEYTAEDRRQLIAEEQAQKRLRILKETIASFTSTDNMDLDQTTVSDLLARLSSSRPVEEPTAPILPPTAPPAPAPLPFTSENYYFDDGSSDDESDAMLMSPPIGANVDVSTCPGVMPLRGSKWKPCPRRILSSAIPFCRQHLPYLHDGKL